MARTIDSTGTGYMMRAADYDRLGGIPADYPNLIFADFALWMSLMRGGYKALLPVTVSLTGYISVCPRLPTVWYTRKPSANMSGISMP